NGESSIFNPLTHACGDGISCSFVRWCFSFSDANLVSRCSLIICPRTLVDHWCNEWRRFFPGRTPARHVEGTAAKWKGAEIVVAAYEDLKGSSFLGSVAWNYVVLDEGHVLRNPKTAIWRAANELNSTSRLILSGTPVQNSPADLWALFTWLMPGYLGDERHFRSRFLRKILKCRSHKANEKDIQVAFALSFSLC
ncbi:protein, SNF2 family, partial [Cooperia oncophora]